jgi:hypothetical protein
MLFKDSYVDHHFTHSQTTPLLDECFPTYSNE